MRRILAPLAALLVAAPLASRAADQAAAWSPDQVKSVLATFGYTAVANLQRTGGTYTADATRFGVALHGITVDAQTGEVLVAPALTAAQAGPLLAAAGYTAVSAVHPVTLVSGPVLAAHATDRSGVTGDWMIDPWSGAVYPATAAE